MGSTTVALADIKANFVQGVEVEQWLILSIDSPEQFESLTKSSSYIPTNLVQQMVNKQRNRHNVGQIVLGFTPVGFGLEEEDVPAAAVVARRPESWLRIWTDAGMYLHPLHTSYIFSQQHQP